MTLIGSLVFSFIGLTSLVVTPFSIAGAIPGTRRTGN